MSLKKGAFTALGSTRRSLRPLQRSPRCKFVLFTDGCTSALDMLDRLLIDEERNEVILLSYAFGKEYSNLIKAESGFDSLCLEMALAKLNDFYATTAV